MSKGLTTALMLFALIDAPVQAQSSAQTQGGAEVEITLAYEEQQQVREQVQRFLSQYDLRPWIFTRKIRVAGGIPHSHPVLTLTTQPEYLASDERQLMTFIHEQLHWFEEAEANQAAVDRAIEDLKKRYLDAPGESGRKRYGQYNHLIVCWLALDAMTELIGEEQARQLQSTQDHYEWVYEQVLQDTEEIGAVLAKHGLVITPEEGLVVETSQE